MEESYIIANRTDVGKVREVNEDSMVTFDSPNGRVVAVCDGMGGQAAGDVASRLACDIITDILTNNKFDTPTEAITRACMAANQGIIHKAAQNPQLEGMGATCVMVIIKDGLVYYGWIGDSRIYYISNGTIRQLTRDQSYVQQLVDQGQITAAEAENHPQKNQILNALGMPNMTPPELCAAPLTPEPGSVILLCSDGLSGMVDGATIQAVISRPDTSLQQKADTLVQQANANGGSDNITVQLVQFGKPAGAKAAASSGGKYTMWGLIIGAVIIAAAIVVWICVGGNKEEVIVAPQKPAQTETVKTTAPAQEKETPKQTQPKAQTPKQTQPKAQQQKKSQNPPQTKKDNGKKANPFGEQNKDKDAAKEKVIEKAIPNHESVPSLDEDIQNNK